MRWSDVGLTVIETMRILDVIGQLEFLEFLPLRMKKDVPSS